MVTVSATGRRCREEAVIDDPPRCERHCNSRHTNGNRQTTMPRFYRETLKGVVADRVMETLEAAPGYQALDTSEELAIARVAAGELIGLFSEAVEQKKAVEPAAMLALDVVAKVSALAATAAKIDEQRLAVAGSMRAAIELVIARCTRAAYEAFGDDYRVKDFTDALKRDLTLPETLGGQGNVLGTGLLPDGTNLDDQVLEMDASVPTE